jgi:hypothetical protein
VKELRGREREKWEGETERDIVRRTDDELCNGAPMASPVRSADSRSFS